MAHFHNVLFEQSKVTPTFFLNFEDLKLNANSVLKELLAFMLDVESIEGTVIEARID
jgi:hypothetical protein